MTATSTASGMNSSPSSPSSPHNPFVDSPGGLGATACPGGGGAVPPPWGGVEGAEAVQDGADGRRRGQAGLVDVNGRHRVVAFWYASTARCAAAQSVFKLSCATIAAISVDGPPGAGPAGGGAAAAGTSDASRHARPHAHMNRIPPAGRPEQAARSGHGMHTLSATSPAARMRGGTCEAAGSCSGFAAVGVSAVGVAGS